MTAKDFFLFRSNFRMIICSTENMQGNKLFQMLEMVMHLD